MVPVNHPYESSISRVGEIRNYPYELQTRLCHTGDYGSFLGTYTFFSYSEVIMDAMASQITSLAIVYSIVYSGAGQRKHQSPSSLAFVRGIHRCPVISPHKCPVTRKCFHLMTSSYLHKSYSSPWVWNSTVPLNFNKREFKFLLRVLTSALFLIFLARYNFMYDFELTFNFRPDFLFSLTDIIFWMSLNFYQQRIPPLEHGASIITNTTTSTAVWLIRL